MDWAPRSPSAFCPRTQKIPNFPPFCFFGNSDSLSGMKIAFRIRFLLVFVFALSSLSSPMSSVGYGGGEMERTFAMVKPDGLLGNYTERIKQVILQSGFVISKELMVQLDEDRAASFYAEHSSKGFFSSLLKYMTSGPVLLMVLEKKNAVAEWRDLIGPTDASKAKITHPQSIRAMCGLDLEKNCVHGSDSRQSAKREIAFFFKEDAGELITKHDEL